MHPELWASIIHLPSMHTSLESFKFKSPHISHWKNRRERERERERGERREMAEERRLEEEVVASPLSATAEEEEEDDNEEYGDDDLIIRWRGLRGEEPWPRKGGGGVTLEGYVDGDPDGGDREPDAVGRTKSLTDEDLEELKGCLDLGFGFSYEEIPELCNTLPALELCYSMSQRFLDDQQQHRSLDRSSSGESLDLCSSSPSSPPIANWKISSPGDNPDEVKARLKYWAQAVACTIRLCS